MSLFNKSHYLVHFSTYTSLWLRFLWIDILSMDLMILNYSLLFVLYLPQWLVWHHFCLKFLLFDATERFDVIWWMLESNRCFGSLSCWKYNLVPQHVVGGKGVDMQSWSWITAWIFPAPCLTVGRGGFSDLGVDSGVRCVLFSPFFP